ncbi:MAG: YqjD family protein [Inhella sp.]
MDTPTQTPQPDTAARERLMTSLQDVVNDAETLLKNAQHTGSEQFSSARSKLEMRLHEAQHELAGLREAATRNVRRAAHAADEAVHLHPSATAGVAAGVGLLVGLLIARR